MSQSGETVTYSLEAILTRIEGKIDRIDDRLTKLEVGQAKLIEKVEGMDKRLERLENEQSGLVKDISDLKGAKSLIIPVTVAIITAILTVFLRSLPSP
ncbi:MULTISPECIES: hypothetical protein [Microcystis]|jgi:predicted nuclease with TOPRIM domain|uniref:Shikimate 5-dehydrogenase n=18 Tax=Microcystis TaxID=1125 RepID=I4HZS5_MICAE|nr:MULTISPECIES: hypothetical protein [Microcystis]MBE5230825.1 hypothetical protein [Microcystis aeruginosa PMC 728.11]MCA2539610.1 hypothetical protein [Microcystis sp. M54BS1]MCA2596684.1 hypothetical protein [Microcystis sp. M38BS1]MCA2608480.1 hypothetical protein [Microcystis sp. M27BS1]MCA2817430.1 hypothetical protein [Microcystis sp. M085S1]MCA2856274.1 hypothetical protein [Microcystis sp. M065S1]MCA2902568.1 hypothetical protein [Microcystis sp. M035S1]MCA2926865.1 hypothetical p